MILNEKKQLSHYIAPKYHSMIIEAQIHALLKNYQVVCKYSKIKMDELQQTLEQLCCNPIQQTSFN